MTGELLESVDDGIELISNTAAATIFWKKGARFYSSSLLLSSLIMLNDPIRRFVPYLFFVPFLLLMAVNEYGRERSITHMMVLFLFAHGERSRHIVNRLFMQTDDGIMTVDNLASIEEYREKEEQKQLQSKKKQKAAKNWVKALDDIGAVEEETTTSSRNLFKFNLDPLALFLGDVFPKLQRAVVGVRTVRNLVMGHDLVFSFLLTLTLLTLTIVTYFLPLFTITIWIARIVVVIVLGPQNGYLYKYVSTEAFQRKLNYKCFMIVEDDDVDLQQQHLQYIRDCKKAVRVANENFYQDEALKKAVLGHYAVNVNMFNSLRRQNIPLKAHNE